LRLFEKVMDQPYLVISKPGAWLVLSFNNKYITMLYMGRGTG